MASAPPCISCVFVARFLGRVLFNRIGGTGRKASTITQSKVPRSKVTQSRSEVPQSKVPHSKVTQSRVPQSKTTQSKMPQSNVTQSKVTQSRVPQNKVTHSRRTHTHTLTSTCTHTSAHAHARAHATKQRVELISTGLSPPHQGHVSTGPPPKLLLQLPIGLDSSLSFPSKTKLCKVEFSLTGSKLNSKRTSLVLQG